MNRKPKFAVDLGHADHVPVHPPDLMLSDEVLLTINIATLSSDVVSVSIEWLCLSLDVLGRSHVVPGVDLGGCANGHRFAYLVSKY